MPRLSGGANLYCRGTFSKKSFNMTLVTTKPPARNEYSDAFVSTITLDDLFLT